MAHHAAQELDGRHGQQGRNGRLGWDDRALPEAGDSKLKEGR